MYVGLKKKDFIKTCVWIRLIKAMIWLTVNYKCVELPRSKIIMSVFGV